ncbi:hypothetical protein HWB57_gp171 [Erwinia phage vB_EamM-Bue1]|uniref:Uncharacterized protein n=1 Tax=Erwinia phage vB_EamM-Bue1 TaxID=2099338 RepID=A0A2P1JUH0_9CAUD|nr:hypothetical protein HWB57_gp171 [Erwinia phage vB_EamM-Bue1]AVO23001.1 hypothetical protein [Erwinia phage vB_EamM-Bue1]
MTNTEVYDYARSYNQRRAKRGMATKKAEIQKELSSACRVVDHWIIMCCGLPENKPGLESARKELASLVEQAKDYV